ncbi:erythromycin esterase family protein [Amycolatopsis sp. NPDC059657]|uniref:erythromycin esterase family protein n=1 Tax=Amycolatopsis sp. NPDC059657 TaxID=3346899 RepID=UPI00366FFCE8
MTSADPAAITAWLAENSVSLTSLKAGADFADLEPLANVFGECRIVGLGESTHGSSEFFTLKHRLVEFMVTELGFRVFAIEAGHAGCRAINDYVKGGEGDPARLLRELGYWTWRTQEVLDLIEWMRAFNANAAEPVEFRGIDPVFDPMAAEKIAGRLDPERAAKLTEALAVLRSRRAASGLRSMAAEAFKSRLRRLIGRDGEDKAHAAALAEAGAVIRELAESEAGSELADDLWALGKGVEIMLLPPLSSSGSAAREQAMADAVARIPGERIILWAHNGHLARSSFEGGWQTFGGHLAERYGDSYYATAFVFDEGGFQALKAGGNTFSEPVEFEVGKAPEGTVEWQLARAGAGDCFVDLRAAGEWTRTPTRMRSFGSVIGFWPMVKQSTVEVDLSAEFDGVVLVGRTTRARPLP